MSINFFFFKFSGVYDSFSRPGTDRSVPSPSHSMYAGVASNVKVPEGHFWYSFRYEL
jgi:hypothetical protein